MTPLHIRLLLHYYAIAEPWPESSGVATEYTADLVRDGLIELSPLSVSGYSATDRGRVHIDGILRLPLPIWVSPL